ncbi:hypothetical protein ES288_A06G157200v1 [Gossypium darwinii]|uniref:Uncharacterized protein n=1 Tax=Gossypium darwinii TaxID=34276 RepID=A0A5D2G681_GOSDA|nr:hypothetical protein ES288_A06G157200v1 [Gossypium darwinii]
MHGYSTKRENLNFKTPHINHTCHTPKWRIEAIPTPSWARSQRRRKLRRPRDHRKSGSWACTSPTWRWSDARCEIRAMYGTWGLLRLQTATPLLAEICLCLGPCSLGLFFI